MTRNAFVVFGLVVAALVLVSVLMRLGSGGEATEPAAPEGGVQLALRAAPPAEPFLVEELTYDAGPAVGDREAERRGDGETGSPGGAEPSGEGEMESGEVETEPGGIETAAGGRATGREALPVRRLRCESPSELRIETNVETIVATIPVASNWDCRSALGRWAASVPGNPVVAVRVAEGQGGGPASITLTDGRGDSFNVGVTDIRRGL